MLAESALWPLSAESLTAWATAVLVIVTAVGLGFTAVAARAAAAAATIAAEQLKLEADPYIIVEEARDPRETPARANSYEIFPVGLKCGLQPRQRIGNRSIVNAPPGSAFRPGSGVPDAPAACLSVKNIGRSPAIRLSLELIMHYGPALGMFDVGYIQVASLAANERVSIWIYNLLDRNIDVFVQKAVDDPRSPALRSRVDQANIRVLRFASLAQLTIDNDAFPGAAHPE